jgi:hypothetical protein
MPKAWAGRSALVHGTADIASVQFREPVNYPPGMDETLVRGLVARREEPRLDFKESPWESSDEFAKDLMAMGNILPRGARAHILVGVRELGDGTGEIIGAEMGRARDAEYHEKVKTLNKVPKFRFAIVPLDGKSVGVFEIEGGGQRPYFPLRDKGVLRRFVPLKRSGTSTDVASPDEVLEWSREDEPTLQPPWHRLRDIPPDARVRVMAAFRINDGAMALKPEGARLVGSFKGIDEQQLRCTFEMEQDRRQLHVPLVKVELVWSEGLQWNVQVAGTVAPALGSTQWSFFPDTSR